MNPSIKLTLLLVFLLLTLQLGLLTLFGQPFISTSGYVKLWEGSVLSAGNSQHLTDWYTFSHVIHGILFYAFTKLLFPQASLTLRLLIALGVEVSWEILENTPIIIQHYREQALSMGYHGDSIINSLCDSLAMMAGFFITWRLPIWLVIIIAISLELWVAYEIRDNLTLNVINLIYVFPSIKTWQAGAML